MFWGIVLKANKKYSQKAAQSFHVSQAALDPSSSSGGPNQVFITYENTKYLICVLENNKCQQVPLDLNFAAGEEISFQSQGNGCIHLTGYLTDIPDNFDDSDIDSEEEVASETETPISKKNGNKEKFKSKKRAADDSDEDEDEVIDEDGENTDDSDEDDDEIENCEDAEQENEDESDEEESDEEVKQPKAKQMKFDKQANKQQNGAVEKTETAKKDKKNKKEKKQANAQQNSAAEKTIQGGVKIQDIVTGTGPEVKSGKKVQVFYEGRLKQNNKVFDSVKQGSGFKFVVGKGDVIKAWDVGVVGMKVGGKRRITCPPHMAYGNRGMPPQIPPNSTLVFEVEVKGV